MNSLSSSPITVRTVIDALLQPLAAPLPEPTSDRLLIGDLNAPVAGIVTTFMPTLSVMERAAQWGANLVIGHEGLFFSHHERRAEVPEGHLEALKRQKIESLGMNVFRFHDGLHRYAPDGVTAGLIEALGWEEYVHEHRPEAALLHLPTAALGEIAADVKQRLNLSSLRIVGDASAAYSRVGVLVGYRGGGTSVIPLLERGEADLILCGEGPEWETPEYVREANRLGRRCGLIVLGHAESEVPGMERLARQLAEQFPGLPVRHLSEEPIFQIF
ncbi:hypothetical protein B9G55_09465 [Saccharibacillus sp. O16]|nr:hypothetical protein B9G55_09465 [Saccharibacillus sp. O16]